MFVEKMQFGMTRVAEIRMTAWACAAVRAEFVRLLRIERRLMTLNAGTTTPLRQRVVALERLQATLRDRGGRIQLHMSYHRFDLVGDVELILRAIFTRRASDSRARQILRTMRSVSFHPQDYPDQ